MLFHIEGFSMQTNAISFTLGSTEKERRNFNTPFSQ